jgi:transposase-like protein
MGRKLKPVERDAVYATYLANGGNAAAAARAHNIGITTVHSWKRRDDWSRRFAEDTAQFRTSAVEEARSALAMGLNDTLQALMHERDTADEARDRITASKAILDFYARTEAYKDLGGRAGVSLTLIDNRRLEEARQLQDSNEIVALARDVLDNNILEATELRNRRGDRLRL